MTWEKTYHVGDAWPPLDAELAYGRDSGLDVSTDLTVGLTYTMTMWDTGSGTKVLDAVPASWVSGSANLVKLRHTWLAGELATAGRFLVRFATSVGGKPVWLPTEGRDLFVVVLALV
jgi:hypothetical protein